MYRFLLVLKKTFRVFLQKFGKRCLFKNLNKYNRNSQELPPGNNSGISKTLETNYCIILGKLWGVPLDNLKYFST